MAQLSLAIFLLVAAVTSATAETCHESCTCEYGRTMRCIDAALTRPPEGYWPEYSMLVLDGNQFTALHNYSFTGFPKLYELYMNYNPLSTLNFQAFVSVPRLKYMFFKNNIIESFAPPIKDAKNEIEYVYLNSNNISQLDSVVLLKAIPYLRELDVSNNPLQTSSLEPLFNHNSVRNLYINGIDASDLSNETFIALTNLEYLYMSNARVRDINGAFEPHSYLYQVDLQDNDITQITVGTFSTQCRLEKLNMSGNPLEQIQIAALSEAMAGGSWCKVDITDTPMACECRYDGLYWWADGRGVNVLANCTSSDDPCVITRDFDD